MTRQCPSKSHELEQIPNEAAIGNLHRSHLEPLELPGGSAQEAGATGTVRNRSMRRIYSCTSGTLRVMQPNGQNPQQEPLDGNEEIDYLKVPGSGRCGGIGASRKATPGAHIQGRCMVKAKKKTVELEVAVAEVVDLMRINGTFAPALHEVVTRKMTAQAATSAGIKVSTREMQKTADAFRQVHDLVKASSMKAWLKCNGISLDAFEEYIRTNILLSKFKDKLEKSAPKTKYASEPDIQNAIRRKIYQAWLDQALS